MGRPVCQRGLLIRCVCRGVVSGALWLHLCGSLLLDILLGDPDAVSVRCNGLLRGCSHLGGVLAAAEPAVDAAPDLAQDGHA